MKNATALMTAEQIAAAKTSELVAFYNANVAAEKNIKKFADRATAEKRVTELVAELSAAAPKAEAAATGKKEKTVKVREGSGDRRTGKRGSAADRAKEGELVKERLAAGHCPFCGGADDITLAGEDGTAMARYHHHHTCGKTYNPTSGKEYIPSDPAARSAAIAASWNDPAVKAARSERNKVRVHGVEYRSVREAFKALGLPDSQHIKFRMELKAKGTAKFETHTFKIVPAEAAAEPAKA